MRPCDCCLCGGGRAGSCAQARLETEGCSATLSQQLPKFQSWYAWKSLCDPSPMETSCFWLACVWLPANDEGITVDTISKKLQSRADNPGGRHRRFLALLNGQTFLAGKEQIAIEEQDRWTRCAVDDSAQSFRSMAHIEHVQLFKRFTG